MTIRFPVDLELFEHTSHTPSLFTLERSMGPGYGRIRDYCIPVNSYFPPQALVEEWQQQFGRAIRYYPAGNEQVAQHVATCFDLDPDCLVMANGATELLSWIDRLLPEGSLLTPIPTFGRWTDVPQAQGLRVVFHERRRENGFQIHPADLIRQVRRDNVTALVICNPNNPTGACFSRDELLQLLDGLADLDLIVIDESFLDFSDLVPSPTMVAEAQQRENVVVIRSLGKNLGLHGLRLGYSVSHPNIAASLRRYIPYWNINAIGELVLGSLRDHLPRLATSREAVISDRRVLERELATLPGLSVYPSQANFVYCRLPAWISGDVIRRQLLTEHGFLVRHCGNKLGADSRDLRIVARPPQETSELVSALRPLLEPAVHPTLATVEARRA